MNIESGAKVAVDRVLDRPEDSEIEVANMKQGVGHMIPFPSIWGHWAGGPGDSKEDVKWLDDKLREVGL
jgi:homoserine O-acetyltransferase